MNGRTSKIIKKFAKEMGKKERAVKQWFLDMNKNDKVKCISDMVRYLDTKK